MREAVRVSPSTFSLLPLACPHLRPWILNKELELLVPHRTPMDARVARVVLTAGLDRLQVFRRNGVGMEM